MSEPPRDWSLLRRDSAALVDEERARSSARHLDEMLARVTQAAEEWQIELELRTTGDDDDRGPGLFQAHLVCTVCRQSVFCLAKDIYAGAAVVSVGMLGAAVTRHYRERHTDGGGTPV